MKSSVYSCFSLICSMIFISIEAFDAKTSIAHFILGGSDLHSQKIFQNDTAKTLQIKWVVKQSDSDLFYTQEPMIKPGGKCLIDFAQALHYFQSKGIKKKEKFDVSLSLSIVLNTPIRPHMAQNNRNLKISEGRMKLTKKDFISKDHFVFYRDLSGKILYYAD